MRHPNANAIYFVYNASSNQRGVRMRAALTIAFFGIVAVLPCRADVALPQPGPQRLGHVDALVFGRVTGFEDQDVEALPYSKGPKVTYRIAVVTVTEGLIGAKAKETIRVGFVVPQPGQPRFPRYPVKLEVGQDGLLYLSKHHEQKFFVMPMFFDFTDRKNPNFDAEIKVGRLAAKALAKPLEGLKSKDAEERSTTAAVLLYRYRSPRQGASKTEAIPAEESKLILTALSEMDWNLQGGRVQPSAFQLFNMLGATPKDGWDAQKYKDVQELQRAARAWLTEHADAYRIQRFVTPAPAK